MNADAPIRLAWTMGPPDHVAAELWGARHGLWLGLAIVAVGVAGFGSLAWSSEGPSRAVPVAMTAFVGVAGAWLTLIRPWLAIRRRVAERPDAYPAAPQSLDADPDGVVFVAPDVRRAVPWPAVRRVAVARQHVFVHLAGAQVLTVPRRAFGDEAAERRALALLRAWRAGERPDTGGRTRGTERSVRPGSANPYAPPAAEP